MAETARNEWFVPDWTADWQLWQSQFSNTMDDIDSTVFANTEGLKFVFEQLPNARVIDDAGTIKLQMTSDLKLISRTLNTTVNVDYTENLTLIPGYMICASVTPGAVGEQDTQFELYGSVPVDPSIRVFGYITTSYSINWYNGAVLGLGEVYRQIFSFLAAAGSDTERVRVSTADTTAGFLDDEIVAGNNITTTILNVGGDEQLRISAADDTYTVMTSAADTTPGYLYPSLEAGTNVTLTIVNPGANEHVRIDAAGGADTYQVRASALDTTERYLYAALDAGANIGLSIVNPGADEQVSVFVNGLVNDQIVYGSATGGIDQSSSLTWDESQLYVDGAISINDNYVEGVTYIDWVMNGVVTSEARQFWDDSDGYMVIGMKGGNVNLQVGGEQLVRGNNNSGAQIDNGKGLRISGATGVNPLFDNIDITMGYGCTYVGMATEDIVDNQYGYGNTYGLVRDVDTTGLTSGQKLYYDTSGNYTHTQPAAGNQSIFIGYPTRIHATEGVVLHMPHGIPWLSYLSDVNARDNTHTEGDILYWDGTNEYWDLNTAVFSLNHDVTERTGDVELFEGAGIIIDDAVGGYTISALVGDIIYTADSLNLDTGTYISGSVTDTETVNLVGYVVQEVAGTPGLDLKFNFVDVDSFSRIQCHVLYQVNPTSHYITISVYNYDTTSWEDFSTFSYSEGYQTIDIPIEFKSGYVDGSGNSRVMFNHTMAGATQHQVVFDYVALVKSGGSAAGGTLDTAYDFGGAGAGRNIIVDAGAVTFTSPIGSTYSPLTLTILETSSSANVINLYSNGSGAGNTIDMQGGVGDDYDGDGHKIASGGPTKYRALFGANEQAYVWMYANDSEGTDYPLVELYAEEATQTDWGKVEVDSNGGGLVRVTSSDGVFITSGEETRIDPGTNLYLDPDSGYIFCEDNSLLSVRHLSYGDNTGAAFLVDTMSLDLATGYGMIGVDLTADCTTVNVASDPSGYVVIDLFVTAVGAGRSLGGFPGGWEWTGGTDLSTGSVTISSGDTGIVRIWRLSTGGYMAQYVSGAGGVSGLNNQQILFGNASGGISQDADFYWDGTDLYATGADIWADSLQKDVTSSAEAEYYLFMRANVDTNDFAVVRVGYSDCSGNEGSDSVMIYSEAYAEDNDSAVIYSLANNGAYNCKSKLDATSGQFLLRGVNDAETTFAQVNGLGQSGALLINTSGVVNINCGSTMTLEADSRVDFTTPIIDLNEGILAGLQVTEFTDYDDVTASASTATIAFDDYDRADLNLGNQSSVTITLTEPSSVIRGTRKIKLTQGSSTATTSITWATSGSSTVLWDNEAEPSWPTGTSDVFWAVFEWVGDEGEWHGMGTGSMA